MAGAFEEWKQWFDIAHTASSSSGRLPEGVTVIRQPQNCRQGAARNAGLAPPRGRWGKFLDADARNAQIRRARPRQNASKWCEIVATLQNWILRSPSNVAISTVLDLITGDYLSLEVMIIFLGSISRLAAL